MSTLPHCLNVNELYQAVITTTLNSMLSTKQSHYNIARGSDLIGQNENGKNFFSF